MEHGQVVWLYQDDKRWREYQAELRAKRRTREVAADPERSAAEACRRATKRTRRFAKAHRLFRLMTLTYAGEGQRSLIKAWEDYRAFRRRLEAQFPGIVTLAFPEPHPGGHGWHFHVLISEYVMKSLAATLWGHGFVDIRAGGVNRKQLSPGKAAAYCAKYIAKTADPDFAEHAGVAPRQLGRHRYRANGAPHPIPITKIYDGPLMAWQAALDTFHAPPEYGLEFEIEAADVSGYVFRWPERAWHPPPKALNSV
jgi:hypothetical protein